MSLGTWEQQALDSIKDGLAGSDPELAALLTTFSQLAAAEEMPARMTLRATSRRAVRGSRQRRGRGGQRGGPRYPPPGWVLLKGTGPARPPPPPDALGRCGLGGGDGRPPA